MAPPKGTTNNPRGSKPDKLITDAIRVALNREAKDAAGKPTKKLALIADQLVNKAVEGDMPAIKEVIDRMEGKAPQAIEHSGQLDTSHELGQDATAALLARIDAIAGRLPPLIDVDARVVNGTEPEPSSKGNGSDIVADGD